jgi:hypothetical protein
LNTTPPKSNTTFIASPLRLALRNDSRPAVFLHQPVKTTESLKKPIAEKPYRKSARGAFSY